MVPSPIAKLLIVDDEGPQMKALHSTLTAEGYSASGFTSATAALQALREQAFDLVLTDLMMPEMDGVSFLRQALEIDPAIAGILMTGHGTLETAVRAMRAGALDYILKPFKLSAVLPVLSRALAVRRLRLENIELHQAVGMYEMTKAVGLASDFETLLQKLADTAAAQKGIRAISVLLTTGKDREELYVAAARGEHAAELHGKRIPFSQPLSQWLLCSRQSESAESASCSLSAPLPDIPGNLSVPMLAGGHVLGVLHFCFEQPQRPIAAGQLKALRILAGAAAAALEAALLLEQVRAADKQYHRLTENAADTIFRYDLYPAPHLAYVNEAVTSISGYSPAEIYQDAGLILQLVHPDDRVCMQAVLQGNYPSAKTVSLRCLHRNGTVVWIELRAMHVRHRDGSLASIEAIARDVTDRKQLEERLAERSKVLQQSLAEKTVLLQEVHHRVKNNLQIICSLLAMQIDYAEGEPGPLHDAQARVVAMSLIHEQIYQSDTLADLNFGDYIKLLSERLFSAYCVDPCRVQCELSVDDIPFSMDQGVPCGLILNELLSNSLKHAFRDGREGVIRIFLKRMEGDRVELTVEDNGIGLPENFRLDDTRQSLGLQIVRLLIRQLGAKFSVTNGVGTTFRLSWRLPRAVDQHPRAAAFAATAGAALSVG